MNIRDIWVKYFFFYLVLTIILNVLGLFWVYHDPALAKIVSEGGDQTKVNLITTVVIGAVLWFAPYYFGYLKGGVKWLTLEVVMMILLFFVGLYYVMTTEGFTGAVLGVFIFSNLLRIIYIILDIRLIQYNKGIHKEE